MYIHIYIAIQDYLGIIVALCDYIYPTGMFKIADMGIPIFKQRMSPNSCWPKYV